MKIEGMIKAGCSCRKVLMSRRKLMFRTQGARWKHSCLFFFLSFFFSSCIKLFFFLCLKGYIFSSLHRHVLIPLLSLLPSYPWLLFASLILILPCTFDFFPPCSHFCTLYLFSTILFFSSIGFSFPWLFLPHHYCVHLCVWRWGCLYRFLDLFRV